MPKYTGNPDYHHDTHSRIGVLLTNLGTPEAPTATALRKYLAEFLSDPRVIEVPRPLWWCILHGFILRFRPRRSAQAYAKIWTDEGSPLYVITRQLGEAVQEQLDDTAQVEIAMRYGQPSIRAGLEKLREANATRLLILPLYPQYSAATTASTFDAVSEVLRGWRRLPDIRMVSHYHDDSGYITALVKSIERHWSEHGRPDMLIFSFHGIPKDYFTAGDPYHCECHKTARLVAESLQMQENDWRVTFQSRFGPREWLQPYTDITLKELPGEGLKHVQVICPGFAADCLETLEEINMQNRGFFMESGGEKFSYIPALNTDRDHVDALSALVRKHLCSWNNATAEDNVETRRRALSLGAKY
ncbi:MAG: ferrochelatase [Gammaproteobacteria bacterium]|nr:ferrochelatase [Gammaproteobacteria bacterium]